MLGKLNPNQLQRYVLSQITKKRKETLISAVDGGDCAILRSERYLYVTSDPITASGSNCGRLAVNICANDLAASGAEPLAILLTLLLPQTETLESVETIMRECESEAQKLHLDIVGGHTEFTDSVNRIVISATALGLSDRFFVNRPEQGDHIYVSKHLALEGTAILAQDYADELKLTESEFAEAKNCIQSISVVKESAICQKCEVSAMHDITEGGVTGALKELCSASHTGAELYEERLPYLEVTNKICTQLGLDKHNLLSSGSMLIVSHDANIVQAMKNEGILLTEIGEITAGDCVNFHTADGIQTVEVRAEEITKMTGRKK